MQLNSFFFLFLIPILQVLDPNVDSVIGLASAEPDRELLIDTASPPDEIQEQAIELIKYVEGERVKAGAPNEDIVQNHLT